jgi:hypothetical protein
MLAPGPFNGLSVLTGILTGFPWDLYISTVASGLSPALTSPIDTISFTNSLLVINGHFHPAVSLPVTVAYFGINTNPISDEYG